ncbi:SDR family oxidoreductase [Paeniglutamicibacter sp. NPDC091659]|uniref:SDR family oxidoreductase n=1 Tax=Paeniglutamicibacter sp. NPDC091659 TaxID=3364389 RepID=UPI0037F8DFC9
MSEPLVGLGDITGQRKVVVLSGATGGMGRAIAADLAKDFDVVALGRDAGRLSALASIDGAFPVSWDLLDYPRIPELVDALPRIDVVVHTAAIARRHSVADASIADWREHLELNVVAPAELTRVALPALREARGQVVFINSGAGFTAGAGHSVYSASKFALRSLADSLRKEEEIHGVRVASVHPGQTDTPMLREDHLAAGSEYAPHKYIRPDSVAAAVRTVVTATEDTQITTVSVRPRTELGPPSRTEKEVHP